MMPLRGPCRPAGAAPALRAAGLLLLLLTAAAAEPAATQVWARATMPGQTAGAAYLRLASPGDDTLLAVESPAAATVELHEIRRGEDGMARMQALPGGIAIPAGGTVDLKPGGLHIMLIGLHAPLRKGQRLPLTLILARGGRLAVEADILDPWAGAFDDR